MFDLSFEYDAASAWVFLVPGVVILFVWSHFVAAKIAYNWESAVSYATISLLYHALALPVLDVFVSDHVSGYGRLFVWFSYLAVVPVLFGIALGVNVQKDLLRCALRRIGLDPVRAMPTAERFVGGYRPQFASRAGSKSPDGRVLPVAPSKPPPNPPNRDSARMK